MKAFCVCDKIKCYCDTYIGKSASHWFSFSFFHIDIYTSTQGAYEVGETVIRTISIFSSLYCFFFFLFLFFYRRGFIAALANYAGERGTQFLRARNKITPRNFTRRYNENVARPVSSIHIRRSAVTDRTLKCGDKPSVKIVLVIRVCSSGLICFQLSLSLSHSLCSYDAMNICFTYSRYVMASTTTRRRRRRVYLAFPEPAAALSRMYYVCAGVQRVRFVSVHC